MADHRLTHGVILVLIVLCSLSAGCGEKDQSASALSDFSRAAGGDVLVVLGDNASAEEIAAADLIESYLTCDLSRNVSRTTVSAAGAETLRSHDTILIGTPATNPLVRDYDKNHAALPGESTGYLSIMDNMEDPDRSVLIVGGNDRYGVIAAASVVPETSEVALQSMDVTPEYVTITGAVKDVSIGTMAFTGIKSEESGFYLLIGALADEIRALERGTVVEVEGVIVTQRIIVPEAGDFSRFDQKGIVVKEYRILT